MLEKKLFLLDGMALIYRSFFAFSQNHRYNSKGLNTSAMFGFTLTLLEVLEKEKPTHIAVVFDTAAPTERHELFPEYKANREAMPEDLSRSIPYIFSIIEAFRIPVITMDGYEADDIIGTLAYKAEEQGFITYMMTPDKDFAQLVSDRVLIYKPGRKGNGAELMNVQSVLEKWEVETPAQVIDILALWGDAVDNIPGIPGVGEKTAKKLIQQYGSVENLIAHAHELKGSQKEKVTTYAEQGLLSKKLATINTLVPIALEEQSLLLEPVDREKLDAVFKELEFKTLHQRVVGGNVNTSLSTPKPIQGDLFAPAIPSSTQHQTNSFSSDMSPTSAPPPIFVGYDPERQQYQLTNNRDGFAALKVALELSDTFCFDTETTSLDARTAQLLGISFCTQENVAYYLDMTCADAKDMLLELAPIFTSHRQKIGHNLKYDITVLEAHGIPIAPPFFDTMLAHYLLEPDKRHKMDELSRQYLQYDPISIESLIGKKGKDQLSMDSVPVDQVVIYACEDADITFRLMQVFRPLLEEKELMDVFDTIEMPLIRVLSTMESNGVALDKAFLLDYSRELSVDIQRLEQEIYQDAGVTFNIASPKQLGEVLFDKLQLMDKPKRTKTGQYQTHEEVLQKLSYSHAIVNKILDFRELQKLKSTYVDALPSLVAADTGRIHTSFNQAVAATGRLSSNNPNLQNIPIRTEKGRKIRKAFVATSPQHVLFSADYSQIELRVIASISRDPHMTASFLEQQDIHTATASRVFDIPYDEVTKDMRSKAKMVNFGIIYGISAFGLSERLGIPRGEAKNIIEEYFIKFPGIKTYMEGSIQFARDHGYVKTMMGRRRYIPDIHSANQTVRGFAERNAINAPIQGSAADMIKLAMIHVQEALTQQELHSRLILQVHDELLLDVPAHELDQVRELVVEKMTNAMPLLVPVVVESGYGQHWLEAH
jgi:DNA polymerase I